ncbi:MAG: efflux RND transporter permease subunit [Planctomycetes bacterium]|nr:efflux RND transporter permease subunit [Planctomycetota bacterium]
MTDVVEDAVAGVEGVNYIMSRSLEGTSIVTIYFHLNRNIDAAMQDAQNAVAAARRKLPIDIDPPIISKVNPNNLPVMWITLSASTKAGAPPVSIKTISDFAEKQFKQEISSIRDVGGVVFGGLQARNIRIHHDQFKLGAFNQTVTDLKRSVDDQHVETPAGYVQSKKVEANLRTMGENYSMKEWDRMPIAGRSNQQIYLKDVAVIEDGTEDKRSFARYSRMPAVAVGVRKAIGGNLVAVCENVKAELPRLQKILPPGVEMNVPVDYSIFVRENVDELKLTLFLGIVLTAGVCFLFLGSLGTTINICLSIPTSLVGTFFVLRYVMPMLGMEPFTINLMTLLGLSLSVGVVVDDAILVLENIYRHREMGKERTDAALIGAREITFAALSATLAIMAIFLPVAFMKGTIGKFFFQFGVTVSVAVFFSLISALTLTPMLCAFFLNVRERLATPPSLFGWPLAIMIGVFTIIGTCGLRLAAFMAPVLTPWAWWLPSGVAWMAPDSIRADVWLGHSVPWWLAISAVEFAIAMLLMRFGNVAYWALDLYLLEPRLLRPTEWMLAKATTGYACLLQWSLAYWWLILAQCAVLIGIAAVFIGFDVLGRELVPSEDQSRMVVHVVCRIGASIDGVDDRLQKCEGMLQDMPEVASFLTTVASEPGQLMTEADIFVQLVPRHERKRSQQELMRLIRDQLTEIRDIRVVLRDQSTEGFTAQRGDPVDFAIQGDWARLPKVGERIKEEMSRTGMFEDIDSDFRPGMPEVRIKPNRDKLAMVGMNMAHIANSLSFHVGGQRIAKYTDGGRRYDVRLRVLRDQRSSPNQLDSILLRAGDKQVPLLDVTTIEVVPTLPVINRFNHQRMIEITANPSHGVSQGEAIARAQEIVHAVAEESKTWPEESDSHKSREIRVVEMGNAQAMRETIESLVFALILGIIIACHRGAHDAVVDGRHAEHDEHDRPDSSDGPGQEELDHPCRLHESTARGRARAGGSGAEGVPDSLATDPDDIGGHGRWRNPGGYRLGTRRRDARPHGPRHHRRHRAVHAHHAHPGAGLLRAARTPARRVGNAARRAGGERAKRRRASRRDHLTRFFQ